MPQVQTYDQSGRVARYGEYDSVCNKIAYVQRALQVITDHIIAPDDILKYSIQIIPYDRNTKEKKVEIAVTRLKEFSRHFKIEHKIKNLVFSTLKYGDFFVEIVPVPKGRNALVVINEGFDYNAFKKTRNVIENNYDFSETVTTVNENGIKNEDTKNKTVRIVIDESVTELDTVDKDNKKLVLEDFGTIYNFGGGFTGMGSNVLTPFNNVSIGGVTNIQATVDNAKSKDSHVAAQVEPDSKFHSKYSDPNMSDDKEKDSGVLELKDINLVLHEPKYVIRLETERFKVCLGYLVFPKIDPSTLMSQGLNTNIDSVCANLLGDIEKKLHINDKDKIKVNDDIRRVLLGHLQKIKKNEDLKIRYVAPELMEHFRINVSKYSPYGESVLDSSLYDCKLLMALKTAATIKKINACSDKRFINVEVGLPRDAKSVVQKMQEILQKKRISLNTMGNIDTIPSQIATLENIYLPMKDNKKFVEIEHQQWGGDTSNDTDNQKQMRDGIVANLQVPPILVGLEENNANRSSATTEYISFCRTIIDYQKEFSIPLHELYSKVYRLVYGDVEVDIVDRIQITFAEPKVIPNTAQSEYLESMQRNIDALSAMGIPKDYLKKRYLPDFDWDRIENAVAKEKLDAEINDSAMGSGDMMGGMMSGGMGGMPGGF